MSLPKYGEDGKLTEPKSSQPTTQEPASEHSQSKQKRAYITNEMRRQSQKHLEERYAARKKAEALQMQEEYEAATEQVQKLPIVQGVDNIRAKVNALLDQSGANTEGSKKDERVLLMASAVLQMCDLLTIYSESMNSEMERLNESASHNLNLQEMYAKTVENVTNLAVGNIYYNLKKQEKEAINELMQYVQANSDQMEKDITSCTENVKTATEAAENASRKIARSVERFRRVKTFSDLLYYASPVLVAADIILRVIVLVGHWG